MESSTGHEVPSSARAEAQVPTMSEVAAAATTAPSLLSSPSGSQQVDDQQSPFQRTAEEREGAATEDKRSFDPRMEMEQDPQGVQMSVEGQAQQQQQRMMDVGDMDMDDGRQAGKRVKVYELREQTWVDLGTGFCEGIYDESQDEALLVVIPEDPPPPGTPTNADGSIAGAGAGVAATARVGNVTRGDANSDESLEPGGFLREGDEGVVEAFLLKSRVTKSDAYHRQQETLIVWTEPSGMDVAISFQDPQGCNDIWDFIQEIQRHLQLVFDESQLPVSTTSSPPPMSPPLSQHDVSMSSVQPMRDGGGLVPLTLSNLKEQDTILKMQSRSPLGRERTVEYLVHSGYIKQMIQVFNEAEDLESLDDLHILCAMMQTILALNDNTMYEHLVQDDLFLGVVGILEYDPEFPTLKASYRQFLSESSRFREPIKFEDEIIRTKIHQTYRLLYLKDVVLARSLDDPTFNILNSLLFFNQVDIINYIQGNDNLLRALFISFRDFNAGESSRDADNDEHRRDVVMLLHQLVLMGKNVQLANRLQLYRNLVDRGLLYVCEWGFRQTDTKVLNASTEMLALILEHDVSAVRSHALRENEMKRKTLVIECTDLLKTSKDMGIKSQIADSLKSMLDIGGDGAEPGLLQKAQRDGPIADSFAVYFYEQCVSTMFEPMLAVQDYKNWKKSPDLSKMTDVVLLQHLAELLAFFVSQHSTRAQFFVLSHPISAKVATLLYLKQKTLRHAALRFFRACLKGSHFIHRHLTKQDLILPLIELLESEGPSDNMLSSACLEVFEIIRKENMKVIINHIFDQYQSRIQALAARPGLRAFMTALTTRWEQNNEPTPEDVTNGADDLRTWPKISNDEDDYFNADSDEEIGPKPPVEIGLGQKRKRLRSDHVSPGKKAAVDVGGHPTPKSGVAGLGLDYDDASDSDGSGGASPKSNLSPLLGTADMKSGLAPSLIDPEGSASGPRIKLKVKTATSPEALGALAMKMSQKRQREEAEEEEGGLAGLMSGGRPGTPRGPPGKPEPQRSATPKSSNALSSVMRETSKKIKLNLGFGKKLGADAEAKKDTTSKVV